MKPRPTQRKALLEIENAWDTSDVIVLPAPVASGKSLLALTVANWRRALAQQDTAILTPQTMLQDQYQGYDKNIPVLKGKARYRCTDKRYRTCEDRGDSDAGHCCGCHYVSTRDRALGQDLAVFNYHSYLFNKAYKDVVIVDEAHNLLDFLAEFYSLKFWKHKDYYPDRLRNMDCSGQFL
jgi:superfamily II DNA or RNA helicase